MDIIGWYLFLPFGALLVLSVPVAFALGLSCAIFLLFSGTRIPPLVLVTEMYVAVNQFALLALPMFVLTGELSNRCNITDRLVDLARLLVGWIKGGLAHVNILASMFFAGISGSAVADAASIGPILIPTMIKENYPRAFSAAVTAASAVIGPIIPPSTVMVIVGAQLQISIGGLFAGGVIPGILIGIILMITAFAICWRRQYGEVHPFEGFGPLAKASLGAGPALLVPLLILGGIMGGVFTPTEAGAVAVFYTLLLGGLYYRTLTWRKLLDALLGTARVTASALVIVATALVFSRILTFFRVPQRILDLLLSISDDRVVMVLIVVAFFLVVGTFMDAVANMIILGPLLMPVATSPLGLGMEPIQYGLFLTVGLLLGLITPPLGLLLFIAAPVAGSSLERTAVATLPFLAAEVVILLLIAFVPAITLAIPKALGFG